MNRIFEVDFEKFVSNLPSPVCINEKLAPRQCTAIITVAGFEPRCCAAAERFRALGWTFEKAFCVHYDHDEMRRANESHTGILHSILVKLTGGKGPVELKNEINSFDKDFGQVLIESIQNNGIDLTLPETSIVFDITVGSSRLLLESLHTLLNTGAEICLAYSESTEYRPFFKEYMNTRSAININRALPPEFLSVGIEKVEILKRIPGMSADTRPTYLIVFPSFSEIRTHAVIEEISPSRVFWLFGIPHLIQNRWRIDAQKYYHDDLIEVAHRMCYVSTFDYRETLLVLEQIYQRYNNDYYFLISSLGSKLQKVGQVLFHLLHPEVGAVASVPRAWDPDRYSGDNAREVYMVLFGNSKHLNDQLRRTKTFRV